MKVEVSDFTIDKTSSACPEQYDVYLDGEEVGYMRLRHGWFYVRNDLTGETVYSSCTKGDGIFEYDERDFHINKGLKRLRKSLLNSKQ